MCTHTTCDMATPSVPCSQGPLMDNSHALKKPSFYYSACDLTTTADSNSSTTWQCNCGSAHPVRIGILNYQESVLPAGFSVT